jgi:hypothetical protein
MIDTKLHGAARFTCCIVWTYGPLNAFVITYLHIGLITDNTAKPKTAFVGFNTIMIITELRE